MECESAHNIGAKQRSEDVRNTLSSFYPHPSCFFYIPFSSSLLLLLLHSSSSSSSSPSLLTLLVRLLFSQFTLF